MTATQLKYIIRHEESKKSRVQKPILVEKTQQRFIEKHPKRKTK